MKEKQKKYNAIDFARYHSGAMLPDEMHALEQAALEDPFLADALDGYVYSKDYEKELSEIRMQLDEKRKQQKVITIYSLSSRAWWKIAAMFILFAGAGYFFYTTNFKKDTSLAVQKEMPKKENPAIVSPAKDDTAAIEGNLAFGKTSTDKNKSNTAKLPTRTAKQIQTSPAEKAVQGEARIREEKTHSEKFSGDENQKLIVMNHDKVVSANMARKDSGEKSFLRSSDTTVLAAAPAVKDLEDSTNAVAMNEKEKAQQKIFIRGTAPEKNENRPLNETVVVGYGTRKKKNITGANSENLEGKASEVDLNTVPPYPKNGKEKFDQYIKDNAVPVLDSTGERIPANILLSFSLNKRGKPNHIKVIESSCKPCEKEAIRLLKTGPDWVGKRGETGNVRIQF